jgi:hypothetical protein
VIDGAGFPVDGVSIAHVVGSFVYPGGGDYRGLLKSVDVTEDVATLRGDVPRLLLRCQQIVAGPMPDIPVGKHCDSPYACQFHAWCDRDRPEHPVDILGCDWRLRDRLVEQGYRDLRDVPEEAIGDGLPHRIWSAAITGASFTDPRAADLLRDLPYPRYYLDFETIQFAVPIWPGTRPYEQLPFQWSCTIEHADGTLDHREFLDTSGEAPMRLCLQALVESIGGEGPVFSYTDFEGRVLREGRVRYPDLAAELDAIALRLVDLHPIARRITTTPCRTARGRSRACCRRSRPISITRAWTKSPTARARSSLTWRWSIRKPHTSGARGSPTRCACIAGEIRMGWFESPSIC